MARRTDLALEEKELWEESAGETTQLPGVRAREFSQKGVHITQVEILDQHGEQALHKPVGTYLTLEIDELARKKRDSFPKAAQVLGKQLRELMQLKQGDKVLVAGLGNLAVTPDAVGPKVLDHLLVTRHLIEQLPSFFGDYRSVAAISPNVLGVTGLESAEVVGGVVQTARPDCLIVVDALASREPRRVCSTVQLADTGITPGSGVSNAREAFNRERFGIPVFAVGVPTVVDMETLAEDYGKPGFSGEAVAEACGGQKMIVTPRDIDAKVNEIAKLIAYGINLAVHEGISMEDIAYFVE